MPIRADALLIPRKFFHVKNLVKDLADRVDLAKRFDLAICLEVAEHLPVSAASGLIATLAAHSDAILFSAAPPGQTGQNHINCQWPRYWQDLFNVHGYICDDSFRWQIWDVSEIEPWYRQNMFIATRSELTAGTEQRIRAVIHPDLAGTSEEQRRMMIKQVENGSESMRWYISILLRSLSAKFSRRVVQRLASPAK